MNVRCPECNKIYRVDPQRLPAGRVRTRCVECGAVFVVAGEGVEPTKQAPPPPRNAPLTAAPPPSAPRKAAQPPTAPPPVQPPVTRRPPSQPAPAKPSPGGLFGRQDPETRARRLARALVSDIVVYHPERRARSLADGTLRVEFRDEILKSWDEYVEQVGQDLAKKTPFFRDALNEILAKGQKVF